MKTAQTKKEQRILETGDVLVSSWGYEQTNVDYYQVVGLIGKRSVKLRKIAARKIADSSMSGKCTPLLNEFVGEEFKKQVASTGDCVRLSSFQCAFKKEPKTIINGEKVYQPDLWSSYY